MSFMVLRPVFSMLSPKGRSDLIYIKLTVSTINEKIPIGGSRGRVRIRWQAGRTWSRSGCERGSHWEGLAVACCLRG